MPAAQNRFHWLDYVVFIGMLSISSVIGIYHAFKGGKQKTRQEYLLGDRKLAIFPVFVSVLVSYMSALSILGLPSEVYHHGIQYSLGGVSAGIAAGLVSWLLVPFWHPMKVTSVYEYLELRYKTRSIRLFADLVEVIGVICYMGFAILAPAVALEVVTGLPWWASLILTGSVGTFYTTLGGMKAVVWTDVFQGGLMFVGLIAIIIYGTVRLGGPGEVYHVTSQGGRMNIFNFDPSPAVRISFWTLLLGQTTAWLACYGATQVMLQRIRSVSTLAQSRKAVALVVPGQLALHIICTGAGMVVYATYAKMGCDPVEAGYVTNVNQMLPYYVIDKMAFPGLPGMFVACLFSGALSTVSSCFNALGAIIWEDIIGPHFPHIEERKKTLCTKAIVLCVGVASVCMGVVFQQIGGIFMQMSMTIGGAALGCCFGVFVLSFAFPWANGKGALAGMVCGYLLNIWIAIGQMTLKLHRSALPTRTDMCDVTSQANMTNVWNSTNGWDFTTQAYEAPIVDEIHGISNLYTVSYLYFTLIGALTTVTIGLIVSFITGPTQIKDLEPWMILPILRRLYFPNYNHKEYSSVTQKADVGHYEMKEGTDL